MSGKVLIAAPVHEVLLHTLQNAGYEYVIHEKINQSLALTLVDDCVGIITSTRLQIDKELIDAAPLLRWVGRMGSGMEVIDVAYAQARGIACYSSPEGNRNAVAEQAMGMLLALSNNLLKSTAEVREGIWLRDENRGFEIEGKTVGIIGFGHTGGAFARKLSGFDVKILAYDKYKDEKIPIEIKKCESLDELFEAADIISFHVPLQEDTIHYFNASFIQRMKKSFILINTSRGKVVDTAALYDGLMSGKVSGVCLDVWEEEPIAAMNPELRNYLQKISSLPQAVVTPHIAGYSKEALYKMSKVLADRIVTAR